MHSVWTDTASLPAFPPLEGDEKTDVLIIGGGITGILCAYMLHQAGADYALVEGGRLCGGITGNTTAKITSQHGLIYAELLRRFGAEKARMYWEANEAALAEYRRLCRDIDCGFQEKPAYVYGRTGRDKLENEISALTALGIPALYTRQLPLPFPTDGAVCFENQAQFHPLRFLSHIARGLNIYEQTPVRELRGLTAVTDRGSIRASRIIVATHFPFLNKHGAFFLKLYQHRSYVLALENVPELKGMYLDEAETGLSFRNYEGLLLLGGGSHRTGKTGGGWTELSVFAKSHYSGLREKYRWATQDCMSLDGVPYIGPYAPGTKGLYVATGFNKWGMTSSMAAAMILRDMMLGKENPWAPAFSPSRSILRPQLFVNGFEAVSNLLRFSRKRCPHMGCALHWNSREHTWDCACHGSRFTEDGALIDNPATGGLKPGPENR